jgi:hypothetical protein
MGSFKTSNKINVFNLNKAEDTYKGYNWHQQLSHFPSDATTASAHCDVALVHLVTSRHDGIQHYVVVITYMIRCSLGEGHVSVNYYSSTTNITKCISADYGYFCQDIKESHTASFKNVSQYVRLWWDTNLFHSKTMQPCLLLWSFTVTFAGTIYINTQVGKILFFI